MRALMITLTRRSRVGYIPRCLQRRGLPSTIVHWKRGKPYVFRMDNLDELLNSQFFFARKFDLNIDSAVVDALFAKLSKRSFRKDMR